MSDFDNELDTMLTETEDTSVAVEEPDTEGSAVDDATQHEAESTQNDTEGSAGGQPDATADGDAQEETMVPLHVVADLRRKHREQMRDIREEVSELRRDRQMHTDSDDEGTEEDDDVPLTLSDLRRIERERAEAHAARTREQQTQRVQQALLQADPNQQRLLHMAEQYLSPRDRERIVTSDDVLGMAVKIASNRIDAFGTDDEVNFLDSLPSLAKQTQKRSASESNTKPSGKKPAQRAADAESRPGPDDSYDSPNRDIIDHMFG